MNFAGMLVLASFTALSELSSLKEVRKEVLLSAGNRACGAVCLLYEAENLQAFSFFGRFCDN